MSEFHTRSEITANGEFIAYLEQLISGSLTSGTGINRALERLSENHNALLDTVQSLKVAFFQGGGTISWNAPNLSFSSNIFIRMLNEIGTSTSNVINSGASSPIALNADGAVAYVVVDRTTGGAVTVATAATLGDFLTAVTGNTDRLDYVFLCIRTGNGITFFDGTRVLNGQSLTNNGFTDSQYGQQTEVTLIRENQRENLNLILTGGGTLTWDESTSTFSCSEDLVLQFPAGDTAGGSGNNTIDADNYVVTVGQALYGTLSRKPLGADSVAVSAVALGNAALWGDNVFVLGVHAADGRFYLWNGTALSDGDSIELGGVASGLQFQYFNDGTAAQVTDLTEGGTYPNRSYEVGSGALMVYRNGVKAKRSAAYWQGGAYPGAGALVGTLDVDDEYVEEDSGSGKGSRIIWLADGQAVAEPLFHPAASHDPEFTWPQTDDHVEAFVGLAGEGPSPVEAIQAFDSGGSPVAGDPLEGVVGLQGSANVSLTYSGNNIVISASIAAGVSNWELSGGVQGLQTGTLTFVAGTNITLDDTTAGELLITCDVQNFEDLVDISANLADSVKAAQDATALNPVLTQSFTTYVGGYDSIWTENATTFRTGAGILRTAGGEVYKNLDNLSCTTSDLFGAETLLPNRFYAIYVGPGLTPGDEPEMVISRFFPEAPNPQGVHPTDNDYALIGSVFVNSSSEFVSFSSVNGHVILGEGIDVTPAFAGLPSTSEQLVEILTEMNHGGWPIAVEVYLRMNTDGSQVGESRRIRLRHRSGGPAMDVRAIIAETDDDVFWTFKMPINNAGGFYAFNDSLALVSVAVAEVRGYWEGRHSHRVELGA